MSTVLIAGATGLVGHELVRTAASTDQLVLLLRRPVPVDAAGARTLVVDFGALPALPRADRAVCCLGTTLKQAGSQAAFRAVDFDAVLAFARAARLAGATRMAVVSSLGASPRSRNFYSRVKGEMEVALGALGFASLTFARPSVLAGDRVALGQPARPAERMALALTRPLSPWLPKAWRPIPAATVARALWHALDQGHAGVHVLESAELWELGA